MKVWPLRLRRVLEKPSLVALWILACACSSQNGDRGPGATGGAPRTAGGGDAGVSERRIDGHRRRSGHCGSDRNRRLLERRAWGRPGERRSSRVGRRRWRRRGDRRTSHGGGRCSRGR